MSLVSLEIDDFRCVHRAALTFDPLCTLIVGENASGKTSLLESIHVLSCGRSLRGGTAQPLIRDGAERFRVVGRVATGATQTVVGLEVSKEGSDLHVAGQKARGFAAIAPLLPVRVIDPEIHRILEDSAKLRRRFMDWGVFHVEPQFVDAWRRYQLALQQRNAALKSKASQREVSTWDGELLVAGTFVAECRARYLVELAPFVQATARPLFGANVDLEQKPGWSGTSFADALKASWTRDLRYGVTTVGPHRADLIASIDGVQARQRVSRGQQKLLVAALMLAQLKHRFHKTSDRAVLLLDDPAAELDVDNLGKLMAEVAQTPAQLIVTSTQNSELMADLHGARFHVKHGQFNALQ